MTKLTDSDKSMLRSLYSYGYGKNNRYYQDIEKKSGKKATATYFDNLQNEYTVSSDTYTDSEGCTYNSLIKK